MSTWATISTSEMPKEYKPLFVEHFGEDLGGFSSLYVGVTSNTCCSELLSNFGWNLDELVKKLPVIDGWRIPVWISLLCSEYDSPVILALEPQKITVILAGDDFLTYIQ